MSKLPDDFTNESFNKWNLTPIDKALDEILHTLWINAELFQHRVEAVMAVDMRTPDQQKDKAKSAITTLIQDEIRKARIEELNNLLAHLYVLVRNWHYNGRITNKAIPDLVVIDRLAELEGRASGLDKQ